MLIIMNRNNNGCNSSRSRTDIFTNTNKSAAQPCRSRAAAGGLPGDIAVKNRIAIAENN